MLQPTLRRLSADSYKTRDFRVIKNIPTLTDFNEIKYYIINVTNKRCRRIQNTYNSI